MDYDDDDYEQYQQYEDELYKDSSDKSEEGSDAGDSEFEDTMLSHIHYSTNVYKKIESTAKSTGETQDSETTGSMAQTSTTMNVPSETDHLAAPPTAVDGYFMAVNQGTELDSENDEGIIKASSANARNPIVIEDEEDSRYSVEKKKDGKWNQQNAASAATHTQDQEDSGSTSESEGSSASSDEMQVNGAHGTEDSSDNEYQLEDSDGLDEHVLEFSKDSQQEEPNDFDLEAELGHLEDKKFLGKNRYYMEKTANQRACYNCGQTGHVSRDCTTMVQSNA
ncbi:hypothetical protein BGX28_003436 [Mortierella sp. GBA30]|nr:hypothetical protein BGX28_003436 [Mortierella sp. GBA30]